VPKFRSVPPPEAVDAVLWRHLESQEEMSRRTIEEDIEAATPALHEQWASERSPTGTPLLFIQLNRHLGWLEVLAGPYMLNAYFSRKTLPHRWHRFELHHQSITLGPVMAFVRRSRKSTGDHANLIALPGGRT